MTFYEPINSGHRIEDHFVDVTEMVAIGSGAERPVKTILLSRYACYLAIQNADPKKEIVALGQTYFAIQTRRQELAGERIEDERRVLLREEMRRHFPPSLSFRPKGEISCPESIATTYTY
jgi:DNA-damage-inducible protein D